MIKRTLLESRLVLMIKGRGTTAFSPTCIEIMDFFLQNPTCYFTVVTASLSIEKPFATVKGCMNLLRINSYLSKDLAYGSAYHITKENMEYWVSDFRNHVMCGVKN